MSAQDQVLPGRFTAVHSERVAAECVTRVRLALWFATPAFTGAIIMAQELVAFRLYAPYFGYSIYVWGSMISVVMAALAVGYTLGGWIARSQPNRPCSLLHDSRQCVVSARHSLHGAFSAPLFCKAGRLHRDHTRQPRHLCTAHDGDGNRLPFSDSFARTGGTDRIGSRQDLCGFHNRQHRWNTQHQLFPRATLGDTENIRGHLSSVRGDGRRRIRAARPCCSTHTRANRRNFALCATEDLASEHRLGGGVSV